MLQIARNMDRTMDNCQTILIQKSRALLLFYLFGVAAVCVCVCELFEFNSHFHLKLYLAAWFVLLQG